jgi:hypothetical protein
VSDAITLNHELIDAMHCPDELDSPQKVVSLGKVPAESSHEFLSSDQVKGFLAFTAIDRKVIVDCRPG